MEGARRWRRRKRRRRRRSWGQTPPPPSPRLLPALSAAAGGGREGPPPPPPPARAPSLPRPLAGSHPGMRESPALGCLPGGRDRPRARGRGARGRRARGSGLAPYRLAGAATRQTGRERAAALIRAIGNRLARLPWFQPRAPPDSPSLGAGFPATGGGGPRQCQSMRERANAGRWDPGWGARPRARLCRSPGPPRCPRGGCEGELEAKEGCECREVVG